MTAYDLAAALPSLGVLRQRCKALAVLDCIIGSDYPYYAYTSIWGENEAALMSNYSGDEWAIVFTGDGAFIRVFDHESTMSPYRNGELWPGLLDGLPEVFASQIEEPAFGDDAGAFVATAVLWRRTGDDRWHTGQGIEYPVSQGPYDISEPDGAGLLRILLDDIVDRYIEFATDYYEIDIDRAAVQHVVDQRPLTDAVVQALNPEASVAKLHNDIVAIAYP